MNAEVSIVMVPRERYSAIETTIDSLYANTEIPFKLIVVDGGLPGDVLEMIQRKQSEHEFELVYRDYPLSPNEARNIGLKLVDTEYVVFTDNDMLFTPKWLSRLLTTAKEEDAWLIGPTILDGDPENGKIHACAGESGFEEVDGKRYYRFKPGHVHKNLSEVGPLERGRVTMLEFHVIMAKTSIFETIGPLDEAIPSFGDHDDLIMSVLGADGVVIYEPESVVGYHDPGTNISVVERADFAFYLLRWSDEWNFSSVDRAAEKWGLAEDDWWLPHAKRWAQIRRRNSYHLAGLFGRVVGFACYRLPAFIATPLESFFISQYAGQLYQLRRANLQKV